MPSFGINRVNGKAISDWEHVLQSVEVLFTTRIGERIMRRHFGFPGAALIGRAMTANQVFVYFYLIMWTLECWEPRLKVSRIVPSATTNEAILGNMHFVIEIQYLPLGHLGDPTPEGILRKVQVSNDNERFTLREVA